ncbi:MAG: response regulator [Candidatus Doudnabacteria bacterium]|nr:response regulator [Candidatus Doudnabacteria bacterium]
MPEKNKKILVVEDDITMREIVVSKLNSFGYKVVEADDGKKAVATWTKEKPDLVLLDLMLPEMDGFTVLETMRKSADSKLANTKVIILSNLWSKEDIERTKKLSIEQFMVKAYHTTEDILEEVKKILSKS